MTLNNDTINLNQLVADIKRWGQELGLYQIGITDLHLDHTTATYFADWLKHGYHGSMEYLTKHFAERINPPQLVPNATHVICASLKYNSPLTESCAIAAFALQQDYHTVLKERLTILAKRISESLKHPISTRIFAGNGPIFEKALAAKAGLGWIGKNTLLIHPEAGSYLSLGEIYLDLPLPPLPIGKPLKSSCGTCNDCIKHCPTGALLAPYQINANRCISYLTIEYRGIIPEDLRPLIGERIFGCDVCQSTCPWNQQTYSKNTESALSSHWHNTELHELLLWDQAAYKIKTTETPLHRLKYECFLRNVAIAIGNAAPTPGNLHALQMRQQDESELVRIHVCWAIDRFKSFNSP